MMHGGRPDTDIQANRPEIRATDSSSAVSEVIGVVLLISIVVVCVSLVAVILFSQPAPGKVPNLNFMTGIDPSGTTLYLYHNGGDTLYAGEFGVLVDGVPASYSISGGGNQWSLGKNLIVPVSTTPKSVSIVYNGTAVGGTGVARTGGGSPVLGSSGVASSGSSVMLRSGSVNQTKTVNVIADAAPYLDCSAVANWACADQIPPSILMSQMMKNVTAKQINLMKNTPGGGVILGGPGYHFNVTVAALNSSFVVGDSSCSAGSQALYSLPVGSRMDLTFTSAPKMFIMYVIAPQLWEMAAGDPNKVQIDVSFPNGSHLQTTNKQLCHTYIPGYSGYDSTITVLTDKTNAMVFLLVNSSVVKYGTFTQTIQLTNLKPVDTGLFLVTYSDNANIPIYLIGWADDIRFNGVVQSGLGF